VTAYVYLLWHKTEPRFKIGKADDIAVRTAQLGAAQFDFHRSRALVVPDCAAAHRLERILHRSFHAFRLIPGEPYDDSYPSLHWGRRDGDTEWFASVCAERVHVFVTQNQDLFDCEWVSDEDLLAQGQTAQAVPDQRKAITAGRPMKTATAADAWAPVREEFRVKERETEQLAYDLGSELEELRALSRFMAVLKTQRGYTLVGSADGAQRRKVQHRLRKLEPVAKKQSTATFGDQDSYRQPGHYFMLELLGEPGRDSDAAECFDSRLAQLVWHQTPSVPDFDLSLQISEMAVASEMLQDVFRVPLWYIPQT
jgi:hypothetical protein